MSYKDKILSYDVQHENAQYVVTGTEKDVKLSDILHDVLLQSNVDLREIFGRTYLEYPNVV